MMGTIHRKTRRWAYSNSNTLALNARKRHKVSQRHERFLLGRFFVKRRARNAPEKETPADEADLGCRQSITKKFFSDRKLRVLGNFC